MLLTSVSTSELALTAYSIILEGQYVINISFNFWINYFKSFVLENLIVDSRILKSQYVINISFNLQISSHKLLYDFSHFLNVSTVFIYFHENYIFFIVFNIELYTFFYEHIYQQ